MFVTLECHCCLTRFREDAVLCQIFSHGVCELFGHMIAWHANPSILPPKKAGYVRLMIFEHLSNRTFLSQPRTRLWWSALITHLIWAGTWQTGASEAPSLKCNADRMRKCSRRCVRGMNLAGPSCTQLTSANAQIRGVSPQTDGRCRESVPPASWATGTDKYRPTNHRLMTIIQTQKSFSYTHFGSLIFILDTSVAVSRLIV